MRKRILAELNTPPLPHCLIITFIYVFVVGLIYLKFDNEFLWRCTYAGFSLIPIMMFINFLFIGYVALNLIGMVTERGQTNLRRLLKSTPFLIAFTGLILLHMVYGHKKGPEPILIGKSGATGSETEYSLGERLEDIVLAKTDSCNEYKAPAHRRLIVCINMRGDIIYNFRNYGPGETGRETLKELLAEELTRNDRDVDGSSKIDLLLRCDSKADFRTVRDVMKTCSSENIGIFKFEFGCTDGTALWVEDERGVRRWKLAERKLNVLFFDKELNEDTKGNHRNGVITIELRRDRNGSGEFIAEIEGRKQSGRDIFRSVCGTVMDYERRWGGISVIIDCEEGISYGQVVEIIGECHRARAKEIMISG